jgi:hypothetical protein
MMTSAYKFLIAALGGLATLLAPIYPLLWVCFTFILVDCLSAFLLNQRIAKELKAHGKNATNNFGKFSTAKGSKIISTSIESFVLLILAHILDTQVFGFFNGLYIANYAAGVICVLQAWSILENASSCNGSRWAKLLQKIMVDKTERHLDINLNELKDKEDGK